MPSPAAVHVKRLTHRYGDLAALQSLELRIEDGTLFGLLGPNGSGKTTLFRILSTLMVPSEGSARVFGFDTCDEAAAVRQRLGVVFQEPALDEALTVRENLRTCGALYGLRGGALQQRIDDLLERFELSGRAGDRVSTLSGGLRRRVDLTRGLLHRPRLLLLDEPTTGLDPVARRAFWQALAGLRRAEGTTLLVATHLMEEAERCDALAILDRGRRVALGTPDALKADLGGKTLWLETSRPVALQDRLQVQFSLEARPIGSALQLSHPDAPALLSTLYDAFGDLIESATVRRPTLDDVFVARTGRRPDEPAPSASLTNSAST